MLSSNTHPAFEAEVLTNNVRLALDLPTFQIENWCCTSLTGHISNPATGGLYRVMGSGQQAGRSVPWSIILKIVHLAEDAPQGWGTDLLHFGYWKREALAYQSGILQDLGSNLKAPRCYQVAEQPDGSVWLWLEDIAEVGQEKWTVQRYGVAARHIGEWQAPYIADRCLPVAPWLQTGWLRSWVQHFEFLKNYLTNREFWDHPLVCAAFPAPVVERLLSIWADRLEWMEILDRMPVTPCHFDTWRPNLLASTGPDGRDKTVALDWQCMGLGPVGEVGNLLVTALITLEMPAFDAVSLDNAIWVGYLQGLQESGWKGSVQQARFCYTAYPVLRWGLVFPMLMILPYVLSESKRAEAESKYGQSIEELLSQWAKALYVLLDLGEEARTLARGLRSESA